ncbi:hypothetical protein GBB61_11415, partial [Bifidobacterium longum]
TYSQRTDHRHGDGRRPKCAKTRALPINVTWQAKGWFNRLVTRHSPLLRRMLGQPDTYRFDDNIASPEFIQERAD